MAEPLIGVGGVTCKGLAIRKNFFFAASLKKHKILPNLFKVMSIQRRIKGLAQGGGAPPTP